MTEPLWDKEAIVYGELRMGELVEAKVCKPLCRTKS